MGLTPALTLPSPPRRGDGGDARWLFDRTHCESRRVMVHEEGKRFTRSSGERAG